MRSNTKLDSAHFQLTPTRTRCDLVITANGKVEKIATGLLNPFLAHLKTAQDQIAKGGYSIILEPTPGTDATWFTKDTVERFVRFVSTPEILERVYTIESEILQIEKAIAIQSNSNIGPCTEEEQQQKTVESIEGITEKDKGRKPVPDSNEEKAIVLYKPDEHLPDANAQTPREENSKVQLVRVLETRKCMLQKEQGMAFARAVAAGFDIDHMAPLISFSQCFGALRLMDASIKFIELWKRKHETGQWLEIEAADAIATRSDFTSMNTSGIVLSSDINRGELVPEENGNTSTEARGDEKHPMGPQQVPVGSQDYNYGHFPNPMYPPWPMHSPPGAPPVFQAYPVQGMPYYQNFPGYGPFFQPPYPSMEESRSSSGKKRSLRRHSMDSKGSNIESQDDSELEKEASQNRDSQKRTSRSGKKIVIRNINYITSNRQNASGSESDTDPASDEESGELEADGSDMKHKNSSGSSRRKGSQTKSGDQDTFDGKEADNGHWQAFQNFLLRDADEDKRTVDQGMFEKELKVKRQQTTEGDDPLASVGNHRTEIGEETTDFNTIRGNVSRIRKASRDELFKGHSGGITDYGDGPVDVLFTEGGGRRVGYRRTGNDDFMISGRNQSDSMLSSSDPLAVNVFDRATGKLESSSSQKLADESYIVPFRSISLDEYGTADREALDMESELPSSIQRADNNRLGRQVSYEPDDLGLMPERGAERESTGYDLALDYEMQLHPDHAVDKKLDVVPDARQGSKSLEKNRKSKDSLDKKKSIGPIRKGKPSKLCPLDEARARADKLRSFKADLQKMKKEKEEEESKRIEALKKERQKRIAARSGSIPAQSPLPSQNSRKSLPTKISPGSRKGSKFSDSAPGLSSPLQRSLMGTTSLGSRGSQQTSKPRSSGTHSAGNRLTHSLSSLPELKENTTVTPESKASMARIRRLSEPKMSSSHVSSVKKQNTKPTLVKTTKVTSDGPESKRISAIINLDKTKAATLPELKIRTSKGPSDTQNTAAKVMIQKTNGSNPVPSELRPNKDILSQKSDGDDNPVIEKTVVMFEPEKSSLSKEHPSEPKMGESNGQYYSYRKGDKEVSNYAAIHAPRATEEADGEPTVSQLKDQNITHEVLKSAEELPNFSRTSGVEKPYQAPYARVSSLEDPCTGNSEYGKAPPTSLEMATTGAETVKTRITNFNNLTLEEVPETLEKPQVKDSSKGFKRLLKFGRKNHTSATGEREPDTMSANGSEADDSVNPASSSDVHTLKNLISRDETPTGSTTTQKSSRHFSLLSPFRSKNIEKMTS